MKKIADFLVKRRFPILILMLVLTVVFAFMIPKVEVNDDMTKYLADSSNMKQGIDIMEEEFPDLSSTNEIRVMFTGLDDSEKEDIASRLEQIDYVDSVSYDKDDEAYNKDDYTLYCISTEYDFGTTEENAILDKIDEEFEGYTFVSEETNNTKPNLPFFVVMLALIILMVVLFAMSGSWIEPLLFLAVIGCAIVLNMGTNIFKGSVSETTFTIAAILQLVLSMDYSIIIMNRYRQELPLSKSPVEAMSRTLSNAFMSVTSSALTTFVGLLMLIFMSFKIGQDLGIVLAKGVLLSLICVFTILPCLILLFNKAIAKTAKPVLPIPTKKLSKFSFKGRLPLTLAFIVILLGSYFLQTNTGISFSTTRESEISNVFPATNSIVVLYNNEDEDKIASLADSLEDNEKVTSVYSYPTTLGKQCTAEDLLDMTKGMDSSMDIEPYMLKLMYYKYYKGDDLPKIKIADLLNFIADDVLTNESFSDYMDSDIKDNISKIRKFADKDVLTKKMSVEELADFFDMDESDIKQMLILYYKDRDDAGTGTMTLQEFVQFLKTDILTNETYASMIDSSMASQIDTFEMFTDPWQIEQPLTYEEAAGLLGIDASNLKLLYVYYYAGQDSYTPSSMTLPKFVSFLQNSVMKDSAFSSAIDSSAASKISQMANFTDADTIKKPLTAAKMAEFMDMKESQVNSIYQMYYGEQNVGDTTMTLTQFLSFLLSNETFTSAMDAETLANLQTMNSLINTALSGEALSAKQLASIFSMDKKTVSQLISAYGMMQGDPTLSSMTLTEFLDFILNTLMQDPQYAAMFDEQAVAQLNQINQMIQLAQGGEAYSFSQMAKLLGMDKSQTRQIYVMYAGTSVDDPTMSPYQMISYLLENETISAQFDESTLSSLGTAKQIMDQTLSGKALGYADMAKLLGMDSTTIKALYTLHDSEGNISSWQLSLRQIVNFICENQDQFADYLGDYASELSLMQTVMNGAISGTSYTYDELAWLLGMNSSDLKQLYLLHQSLYGDTSGWGMTPQEFVSFIRTDILTNDEYKDAIDADQAESLDTAQVLIDAVVSDKAYSVSKAYNLLKGLTDSISKNDLTLLYTYYGSLYDYDETWTLSIQELFNYLNDDLLEDPSFGDMIDEDMKADIRDMQDDLSEAVNSLKGPHYSLLSISTTYEMESDDTFAFLKDLHESCDQTLSGDHYFIGSSAMYYEMSLNFRSEMLMMTLLTAISIFIIVLLSFRSLAIPILLVLLVQTAVFATVAVSFVRGYSINYLSYLIVQCILMGATIDYAILMTNNYRENRKLSGIRTSLRKAYATSMHTILTSGLIMILVTGIIGFSSSDPNIGPICQTISIGSLIAVILIIFVLPAMLAVFDRFVCGKGSVPKDRE